MDDCHIRPIEHRDLERVLGIVTRNDEEDEDAAREFFREYFQVEERDPKTGFHYVIGGEEDLFGVGGYVPSETEGKYWIGWVFVDPYYQSQGLGTRLLSKIEEDLLELGANELCVRVKNRDIARELVRFYEVNGFVSQAMDSEESTGRASTFTKSLTPPEA